MTEKKSNEELREEYSVSQGRKVDEINLLEYIYTVVKYKWWLVGALLVGIAAGYIGARLKGPTWVAEAVIAAKENGQKDVSNLSTLGAFGGLVSSQLGGMENASLDKIKIILDSRGFNARLITKFNLLPDLYKVKWNDVYSTEWDTTAQKWRNSFKRPNMLGMGDAIKRSFLEQETSNNLMTIRVRSKDSLFTDKLITAYLSFLDEDIKTSVQKEAGEKVEYLEQQLMMMGDPLLREKIQTLIADEIEKKMIVSKEAFKVVDPIYLYSTFKAKKLYPLFAGGALVAVAIMMILLGSAVSGFEKTEYDRLLLDKIKKSLFIRTQKK